MPRKMGGVMAWTMEHGINPTWQWEQQWKDGNIWWTPLSSFAMLHFIAPCLHHYSQITNDKKQNKFSMPCSTLIPICHFLHPCHLHCFFVTQPQITFFPRHIIHFGTRAMLFTPLLCPLCPQCLYVVKLLKIHIFSSTHVPHYGTPIILPMSMLHHLPPLSLLSP